MTTTTTSLRWSPKTVTHRLITNCCTHLLANQVRPLRTRLSAIQPDPPFLPPANQWRPHFHIVQFPPRRTHLQVNHRRQPINRMRHLQALQNCSSETAEMKHFTWSKRSQIRIHIPSRGHRKKVWSRSKQTYRRRIHRLWLCIPICY